MYITTIQHLKPVGKNVRHYQALQLGYEESPPVSNFEHNKAGASYRLCDISATRLSLLDP
jgi:hypothetical protein